MDTNLGGNFFVDLLKLLVTLVVIAGAAWLWQMLKQIKIRNHERVVALVFLLIISVALHQLWSFNSPNAPNSEPRKTFEMWRLIVTFCCVSGGFAAGIALVCGYREK